MKMATLRTIFVKEMIDTLRDKRTLIAMIGVPMVLYPVLLLATTQIAIVQQTKITETASKVAIQATENSLVHDWVAAIPSIEVVESGDPRAELDAGDIDALVIAEGSINAAMAGLETFTIAIEFDTTAAASREARERLEDGFSERNASLLDERLNAANLDASFARPLLVETENIATPSKAAGMAIGMILPLLMVTMLGVGAFYPAIDLTAGEKERGTFETLLSTPTSKLEIIGGKFLTVFTLSMITGILNLASIVATVLIQIKQMTAALEGPASAFGLDLLHVSPLNVLAMLVIMIPLAFFISAMMMSVSLLARSFKDAQNYITPFFIAIILPAGIAAIPDVELTAATQFIPIANIALLFRGLMMGKATLDMVFIVFTCTALYAVLSLLVAVWMFQREEVILSEEKGIPLSLRRSEITPTHVPSPGVALGTLVIVMLLLFYVGSYAQARHLQWGLLITEYGVILAPVLGVLWFARVNIVAALNLRMPSMGSLLGTVLIAPACLVLVLEISVLQNRILPVPIEIQGFAEKLFSLGDTAWAFPALLFIIALSPAICEEALFRGVLVSGLRSKLGPWMTVVIVGLLFGLFHLSIYRFVPTALLGGILTYIVVRSGSIVPGMIGHFIINGASVTLETGHVPKAVIEYIETQQVNEQGLPLTFLAGGALLLAAGVLLVEWSAPRSEEPR